MSVPQPPSKLWEQAVTEYIAQLNITDAEAIKQGASNPDKFIQALKISGNSPKNDHVSRSLEKLLSAAMLVSGAVPDFTSVVWCSVELLYNRSQQLDNIRSTIEEVFIELGDSLPRLLGYEVSEPYDDLNLSVLKYFTDMLQLFLEASRYINKSSKKKYILTGPPEPFHIFQLIQGLKRIKADIEAQAVAISMKQHHDLMERAHTFMNRVVIQPKANLPCYLLAYPENLGFRGKRRTLDRIAYALKPNSGQLKSYALYGLAGVGKTQLALKFAYSHLHLFKAIFWIAAETKGKLTQGLCDAAQQLGFVDSGTIVDQDSAIRDFMSWLRSCDDEWLTIFDNVNDFKILTPYWPCAKSGSILTTSRNPASLQRTSIGERVDSMEPSDAKEMFFTAIEHNVPRNEDNEHLAEQILHELGYLPLAIRAATGIIVETECDLPTFIRLCQENGDQPEPFAHLEPDVTSFDYEHTLATVWDISLQKIDARSTHLLRILMYLDPDAVPEEFLRKGASSVKDINYLAVTATWLQASRELRKHGLCWKANIHGNAASRLTTSEHATTGIATHRLVLQTVFHRCSNAEKSEALAHVVAMLKSEYPSVSDTEFRLSTLWRECQILLPHVEAVISRCRAENMQLPSDFVPVLCACGRYLIERRSFKDAERLFTVTKEVCKAHGLNDWQLAQFVQRSLGGILLESSAFRCEEAVQIFQSVVAQYEGTLEPEDPILAVTYADLAQALTARGEYDEAITLCERALMIVSKIEDMRSRRDTMFHIHHNMARVYEMKGLPDEALRLHFHEGDAQGNGLRQEQSVYGAWNLYAIGNSLQLQRDRRAMEFHTKALNIRHQLLGDHYYTAISYHKLGQLHLEDGAFEDANEDFEEAHRILSAPSGDSEAELARTLWYWSLVKKNRSEDNEAAQLSERAIRIRNKLPNQQRPVKGNWNNEEFDHLVVYYNR